MPLPEVCVCYLLRERDEGPEVLLGRKKFGLGEGNLVGPGGKLEPGETPEQAITREVFEETGLVIRSPQLVGSLVYPFPSKPAWSQKSWVFLCRDWSGKPVESEELVPEWFAVDALPVDRMWDDAKYWLPGVLAGGTVSATFEFGEDLRTVSASDHPAFITQNGLKGDRP
jgi:8-oxo-dGTP diphosphatase